MDKPLVSVAMTTYNGEAYLVEQLDSIVNQDYKNIELIVCDDGSTDSTMSMLGSYRDSHPDLRMEIYPAAQNLGYVKNFEKAISFCRGKYIAFCDQDDIWYSAKISKQLDVLLANTALAVFTDADLIDAKGRLFQQGLWGAVIGGLPPETIDHRAFYLSNCVTGCTLIIDRTLLDSALPFIEGVPHDWWLAYHAAYLDRLSWVDEKLLGYRQHGTNVYGVGGRLRRERMDFYFRHKLDKWKLNKRIKLLLHSSMEVQYRLNAMAAFEARSESGQSEELSKLNVWIKDRLLGKNMEKYKAFFQSTGPAFKLIEVSASSHQNVYFNISREVRRFYRKIAFLCVLALGVIALCGFI